MAYFLQNFKNKQKRLKNVFLQNRGKIIEIRKKKFGKKGKNREKKNRKKNSDFIFLKIKEKDL